MADTGDSKTLPMKGIVIGLSMLFAFLCIVFLIVPAFFDVHITDALFEKSTEPWILPQEEQARLGMTVDEMKGKFHFDQMCASCHGPWGQGGGPQAAGVGGVPDLTDPASSARLVNGLTRKGLLKTLDEGVPGTAMPAFPQLARHVRDSLADFVLYTVRHKDRLAPPQK